MRNLVLILEDQLSHSISSLNNYDSSQDVVFMCEVLDRVTRVKHHKKKIAFLFSAMRHFAKELREKNYKVDFTKLDDPDNSGSLKKEVARLLKKNNFERIIVTSPSEYYLLSEIQQWQSEFGILIEIRADNRFFCSVEEFSEWAKDRKQLRMENFYREIRRKHKILMQGNDPVGGRWNFDSENRKPPKKDLDIPPPYIEDIDDIKQEVIELVAKRFGDHFGDLDPFFFAVTREDALKVLDQFIKQRLPLFGDYQDAMIQGEPWMYHSHISFYLNCGLLLPSECVRAAEQAYALGNAPLNAVEGFIRQIIGWREYVRGVYWLNMPEYISENFFEAERKLPDFYWTANTKMNCLSQCISETKQNAYAHHIQRLMVLGNFALLTGINPRYVNEWFLIVYADAFEWVELPNVSGMVLFADGGHLASKPYAAGGSYINKMSDYCKNCSYKVNKKGGPNACPFNYLYWDFLDRNRDKLKSNHRLGMMYKTFDRMSDEKKKEICNDSAEFLRNIDSVIHV